MGEQYSELSAFVRTIRSRWRMMSALRALTLAAASTALVAGLALMAQYLVSPEGGALIALWMAVAVASLISVGWFAVPLRRGPTEHQVARYIEECCPELEDALVTAIVHGVASSPSPMALAVAEDALRRTRGAGACPLPVPPPLRAGHRPRRCQGS